MVALIKGSPYVAISAGQVSNHPCPCLKIERTNDVKADAGCSTLFRVSLSRQRRSGPVAMLELSRLFELAGGTRGMTDRPFDLERALPPLVSCPPAPFFLSLSLYLSRPSLSTPSWNSLENLSGGRCQYAAKINPKRAQKKIPRLYSPANRSSRSLALRSISPSSSPPLVSILVSRACTTNDRSDRSLPLFPRSASTLATAQARCDYSSSRFA